MLKKYFKTREEWRQWLSDNYDKEAEVWFVFPLKSSGETAITYNDAVEEALCFGWIDSTNKALDAGHKIQKFSPRKPKSAFSQANKERLRWLTKRGLIHPSIEADVAAVLAEPFIFPQDIMEAIMHDADTRRNFERFSESYKRIRIAYIDAARNRPDEFEKRLHNFVSKTKAGKMIAGYGGINKYY